MNLLLKVKVERDGGSNVVNLEWGLIVSGSVVRWEGGRVVRLHGGKGGRIVRWEDRKGGRVVQWQSGKGGRVMR